MSRALPPAALLGLVLSTIPWYLRRMTDRSDEPLGWIALVTLIVLLLWIRLKPARSPVFETILGFAAIAVILARPLLPDLIYAGFAVGLFLTAATHRGMPPAGIVLGLLSLPVLATLDFYLGYPLRLAAGWVAAGVLGILGDPVAISGISLVGDGFEVIIDRPCTGLRYLWCGWFTAAVIGMIRQLRGRDFRLFAVATTTILFSANVLRITVLFALERAGFVGDTVHEFVGLAVFGLTLIPLIGIGTRLGAPLQKRSLQTQSHPTPISSFFRTAPLALLVCLIASARPLDFRPGPSPHTLPTTASDAHPRVPTHLLGYPLVPHADSASSPIRSFFESHRIRPQVFSLPHGLVLLRQTGHPSRAIHPADDCFRGAGFQVRPLPLWRDPFERTWRRFEVTRASQTLTVYQLVVSTDGEQAYADISQWYWNALRLPRKSWNIWTLIVPSRSSPLDQMPGVVANLPVQIGDPVAAVR